MPSGEPRTRMPRTATASERASRRRARRSRRVGAAGAPPARPLRPWVGPPDRVRSRRRPPPKSAGVGARPSISPSTLPAAKTSARSSIASPRACSGAMYAGVPPLASPGVPRRWASPKSSSFTLPSSQRKTLAGLRSRWSTPRWCAWASPRAISSAIRSASAAGIGPSAIRCARVFPRRSSITRYGPDAQVPTSKRVTMHG